MQSGTSGSAAHKPRHTQLHFYTVIISELGGPDGSPSSWFLPGSTHYAQLS